MNSGGVKVQSEAIAELETALGRFAQAALERLTAAETAIRRTAQQLENRRCELRRELSRLQDEIANADEDDDTSHATRRYEEAEEALGNVRRSQRTVDDCVESYKREAARLRELSEGTTVEARAYLRRVLDDLFAYFRLQPDGLGTGTGSIDLGSVGPLTPRATFDPTSYSLPAGFRWVRICEIDTVRELSDVRRKDSFEKVSYEEMRNGFEALRTELLPAISDSTNPATKDTFRCRDAAEAVRTAACIRGILWR